MMSQDKATALVVASESYEEREANDRGTHLNADGNTATTNEGIRHDELFEPDDSSQSQRQHPKDDCDIIDSPHTMASLVVEEEDDCSDYSARDNEEVEFEGGQENVHTNASKDSTEVTDPASIVSSLDNGSNHSARKRHLSGGQQTETESPKYHLNAFLRDAASPPHNNNPAAENSATNQRIRMAPFNAEEDLRNVQERNTLSTIQMSTTYTSGGVKFPFPMRQSLVRFDKVEVREYEIAIGDNPYCSYGVPITLDWSHGETESMSLDSYEASHGRRKPARRMLLTSFQRRDMLWRAGYELDEIERAIKENEKEKFRRSMTLHFLPVYQLQEIFTFAFQKVAKRGSWSQKEQRALEETVMKQQRLEQLRKAKQSDMEVGAIPNLDEDQLFGKDRPRRRLSFRFSSSTAAARVSQVQHDEEYPHDGSVRSGSMSESSHDRDDPYSASSNSRFKTYSIRVDRGQHDKATEITLCDLHRPHMRAFHASWFSFFIAFFAWFSVTPLLGEVKDSLGLSKADVWTSSLCGTAGTIIMRIMIGPFCDLYGARMCMAFILTISAIPCALTGLVHTSRGLNAVRSFVGIAGSSFVACQYWTSQMFTREVAGTANALVAGWGRCLEL